MDRIEFEDLVREALVDVAPNFSIEENDDGQLIILTNLTEDADSDELIPFESDDEFDEEEELDDLE